MDPCPDNATECLLRAVLTALQEAQDWDPASFGVTLAIGILALIVACLTIFQSVLAAGPGRLKASFSAIGGYSRYTRSRFDWQELRVRTTTKVPFIEIPGFTTDELERVRVTADVTGRLLQTSMGVSEGDTHSFAAGWANLLGMFSQAADHVPDSWELSSKLISCTTDYVPGDVAAAPATSSIASLIIIAALAGCDTVTLSNGLPIAAGNNMLMSFRDHPTLGLIAAYQVFDSEPTYRVRHWLSGQLSHCKGINHTEVVREWVLSRVDVSGFTVCLLLFGKYTWPRATLFQTEKFHRAAVECARKGVWAKLDIRRIIASLYRLLENQNKTLSVHELPSPVAYLAKPNGAAASKPFDDLSMVPKLIYASDRNPGPFASFCHNDIYWPSEEVALRYLYEGRILVPGNGNMAEQRLFSGGYDTYRNQTSQQNADINFDFILIPLALLMCLRFLQDSEFFRKLPTHGKSNVRGALKLQLVEVERWLSHPELQDASKTARQNKLRADVGSLEIEVPKFEPMLCASMAEAMAEATDPDDGLNTLITYRAVLTATFLSTAADVSCVAGTALGRRIVQII